MEEAAPGEVEAGCEPKVDAFGQVDPIVRHPAEEFDVLRRAEQHYAIKKRLLKNCFAKELALYLVDPQIRHDSVLAPVLFRAYKRATVSPLVRRVVCAPGLSDACREHLQFPLDGMDSVERFVDLLPLLQRHAFRASKRNLAQEIANMICNSWCAALVTRTELEARSLGKTTVTSTIAEDNARDVAMLFGEFTEEEEGPDADASSDDDEPTPLPLDPALARRRERR
jgi:hypothetical protein